VGYAQDIPLQQSGVRKNTNRDYDFAAIAGYGLIILMTDYVAYVAASDFAITEGTRIIIILRRR